RCARGGASLAEKGCQGLRHKRCDPVQNPIRSSAGELLERGADGLPDLINFGAGVSVGFPFRHQDCLDRHRPVRVAPGVVQLLLDCHLVILGLGLGELRQGLDEFLLLLSPIGAGSKDMTALRIAPMGLTPLETGCKKSNRDVPGKDLPCRWMALSSSPKAILDHRRGPASTSNSATWLILSMSNPVSVRLFGQE